MGRTVLVPLGEAAHSTAALSWARYLASDADTTLVLARVDADGDMLYSTTGAGHPIVAGANAEMTRAVASQIHEETAVRTAECGSDLASAILRAASRHAADVVVMDAEGGTCAGRPGSWLGAVAAAVLHDATVPVMLVPAGALRAPHGRLRRTILVPLDGTPPDASVLRYVVDEPFARGADIILARAIAPRAPEIAGRGGVPGEAAAVSSAAMERLRGTACRYIDEMAHEYLAPERRAWHGYATVGDARRMIVDVARYEEVELIAVTAAQGDTDRDVIAHIMRQVAVPILYVPARPAAIRERESRPLGIPALAGV